MLFGKKKQAPAKPQETIEQQPKTTTVETAKFSGRIAGVFSRMYSMILSVDLQANVYQIESGACAFEEIELPVRGYYDNWYSMLYSCAYAGEGNRLAAVFSREKLLETFLAEKSGVSGVYQLGNLPNEGGEQSFRYYELRADRLPGEAGRARCIIYVRQVGEPEEIDNKVPGTPRAEDINKLRVRSLLSPEGSTLFEYHVANDVTYVHDRKTGAEKVIKNYLRGIDSRCDWTVFHDDVPVLRDVFKRAVQGESVKAELRYRLDGVRTNDFCRHSVTLAPDDAKNPKWLLGVLCVCETDESKERSAGDVKAANLFNNIYVSIHEVDVERDLIYTMKSEGDSYRRIDPPKKYSESVRGSIANGYVKDESAEELGKTIKKGYLRYKASSGYYVMELRMLLPGAAEPRWYADTFVPLPGGERFLRLRRDINEQVSMRQECLASAEQNRMHYFYRHMLNTIAGLVEFRNVESGAHILHVCTLTRILLMDMADRSPMYGLDRRKIELYSEAAIMHDIGKITIPDTILNKAGPLTEDERRIMETHTTAGEAIIRRTVLEGQEEAMEVCRLVALHHHERYDGKGYPAHLSGDDIPIAAQVVGLVDAYDALVSDRSYKTSISHEEALQMILSGKCGAFNPRLLESLKICAPSMKEIYEDGENEALS